MCTLSRHYLISAFVKVAFYLQSLLNVIVVHLRCERVNLVEGSNKIRTGYLLNVLFSAQLQAILHALQKWWRIRVLFEVSGLRFSS